jgi:hypothetical protein
MTVATQPNQNTTTLGDSLTFGFLVWWTIQQGIYDRVALQNIGWGRLPSAIQGLLTGADAKTAWLKATQLGAKGSPSATQDSALHARFLTRDVGDNLRAVIREEIDERGKAVSTQQLALLGYDDQDQTIAATIQNVGSLKLSDELVTLIESMAAEMEQRTGSVDDTKIRSALLRWLELKHRVCVRGTGGVYYLPLTPATLADIRAEVIAVRAWVQDAHLGTFSVVQLTKDGATSVDDFQQSAVQEILDEVQLVNEALDKYQASAGMNDGSRMYSAATQVEKIATLKAKATHLEEAMGEVLGKVQIQLDLAEKRAATMRTVAAQAVQIERTMRAKGKAQSGKKSGLAQERAKHKKV